MKNRKLLLTISILIFLTRICLPVGIVRAQNDQEALTLINLKALEQTVQSEMQKAGVPGATVTVVYRDRVIFNRGFGVASVESDQIITPSTLFRLGSTAKMFLAVALLTLVEQGKIKLDAPIGNYAKNLHPKLARLTLHQLLSHTAGLKDDAPMNGSSDERALAERVTAMNENNFFTEPGRVFSYANPGYVVAGYLLEQIGSKPFADMMAELVFQPLAMAQTTYRPLLAMTHPLSQGHNSSAQGPVVVRPFAEYAGNWPPGSIFSNSLDLSRFLTALLNGGKLDNRQVISESVIKALFSPRVTIPVMERDYGYGLFFLTEYGLPVSQHTGSRVGFGSIFLIAPEQRFAVIVLANRTGAIFSASARKAIELVLQPQQPREPVKPVASPLPITATEMANYSGTYANNELLRCELLVQQERLFVKVGKRLLPVDKIGEHRFQVIDGGPLSNFMLMPDADSQTVYLMAEVWALQKVK